MELESFSYYGCAVISVCMGFVAMHPALNMINEHCPGGARHVARVLYGDCWFSIGYYFIMTLVCSAGAVYLSPFADIKTLFAVVTTMWSATHFLQRSSQFPFMCWFVCFVPAVMLSPYIHGIEALFAVVMLAQIIRVLFFLDTRLHVVLWLICFVLMIFFYPVDEREIMFTIIGVNILTIKRLLGSPVFSSHIQ